MWDTVDGVRKWFRGAPSAKECAVRKPFRTGPWRTIGDHDLRALHGARWPHAYLISLSLYVGSQGAMVLRVFRQCVRTHASAGHPCMA